ncbi:hypothetical protein [Heyndrickxia coagulans]|uniref:hypothetical protein n=1 Tax=Heyndrickxia coagulans TaxID=1398 RepID=UPI0015FCB98C|nr:hypothetical protein [Heyndrickxia coagulans]
MFVIELTQLIARSFKPYSSCAANFMIQPPLFLNPPYFVLNGAGYTGTFSLFFAMAGATVKIKPSRKWAGGGEGCEDRNFTFKGASGC